MKSHTTMVVAAALMLGMVTGCSPTGASPTPASSADLATSAPVTPTPEPLPTPEAVGAVLCGSIRALQDAQDEHASPLATYIGDTLLKEPSSSERATALSHATAIAATFLEWGPKIDGLKSAELAPLIVVTKRAYAGYGEGVTLLKPVVEGSGGDTLTALQTMRMGRDNLVDALDQLELLDASGSLDCPA